MERIKIKLDDEKIKKGLKIILRTNKNNIIC